MPLYRVNLEEIPSEEAKEPLIARVGHIHHDWKNRIRIIVSEFPGAIHIDCVEAYLPELIESFQRQHISATFNLVQR